MQKFIVNITKSKTINHKKQEQFEILKYNKKNTITH